MFKIDLENRKSLDFIYILDSGKEKNGLRQGAGIIQWTMKQMG